MRRARLAQVAAIIVRHDEAMFEVLVDRSAAEWLSQWLAETAGTLSARE